MRLIRISLAAKYRLLFGVAVLLIIGAALSLPWHRVEQLVLEKPFREAQRVADDYFRMVLAAPGSGGGAPASMHGREIGLLSDRELHEPAFVPLNVDLADPRSLLHQVRADPFVARAVAAFQRNPAQRTFWEAGRDGRGFQYAHAVRASRRCLECHGEGKTATRYTENELAGIITVNLPIDDDGRDLMVNRAMFLAAGLLAGFLAILVFYYITHRFILSPIDELRGVARQVTEGDLSVRSNLRTGDEFEQLAASLNTMLERLRTVQEELRTANRSLDLKLGEMAETNVALYEANKLKSEFLANVSHELRTPLTSIIGFAELLHDAGDARQNGKAARYVENILISGRILLEIINDLLDLAKIEAGKVDLRIDDVNVVEVCQTLVEFTRPLTDKKRISVALDAPAGFPILRSDRGKIRQVLFNLLSNAIKFTPDDGRIRITLERPDDDRVRIAVSDTGPGIDPDHQRIIFEKFRQIDGSATREHPGTGLGLAIARELTTLLGGTIAVRSEPGRGATFWVDLPLVAPQLSERPPLSLV